MKLNNVEVHNFLVFHTSVVQNVAVVLERVSVSVEH